MKTLFKSPYSVQRWEERVCIIGLILLSIIAWIISYHQHLTVSYNDAMAHLNISRLIVDDMQPGFSQLGGVWLPLNHVLDLTLIWNDWAWHSGFAGSFFSMIAYVVSAIAIFKTLLILTSNKAAGFLGGLVFAINPNILYLQSTPLTEPLFLVFFSLSVLFFTYWIIKQDAHFLFALGITGFFMILTRYDGWFVIAIQTLLICTYLLVWRKENLKRTIGIVTFYLTPIVFAIILWLLWNLLIFHTPFYFIIGPYSAHAQQSIISTKSVLITKHNILESIRAYGYDMLDNAGNILCLLSLVGALLFLSLRKYSATFIQKVFIIILLLSPVLFNILALYFGFSILNIPQLHWNPSNALSGEWFNVRYGILVLPFVAVMVGMLATFPIKRTKPLLVVLLVLVACIQSILIYKNGVITVIDGQVGSSAYVYTDVSNFLLSQHIPSNQKVLLSTAYFSPLAFKSGFHLDQVVHEGVSRIWPDALAHPQNYVQWIVMSTGNQDDPVYKALVITQQKEFLTRYKLVYTGEHANVYEAKAPDELYVERTNGSLNLGNATYVIKGVNSYDLAYRSKQEITDTFTNLHAIGVNTVRFWAFGDGMKDGFQPQAGIVNEQRLQQMDFIIAQAKRYHIRLIPVLVNNWTDYGGKAQYISWVGKDPTNDSAFYTDPVIKGLVENYINKIISRKNTITNIRYGDDPSILGWDIMNEPRVEDGESRQVINSWTESIAKFIKQEDHNHLVLVGTEEATTNTVLTISQPQKAADLCALPNIDICSLHLYLTGTNGTSLFNTSSQVSAYLEQEVQYAKAIHKPIILEEFGVEKNTTPFSLNPLTILQQIVKGSQRQGYKGVLIWNWSQIPDTSFGFSPQGDDGMYTLTQLQDIL